MKITTLIALGAGLVLTAGVLPAQAEKEQDAAKISDIQINMMRKDLRDQRKQIVAANMPLTGDEAAKFWPLYDAYTQETIKVNDHRFALMKEYAANYSTMTEEQAGSYIRRWIDVDAEATKLRLAWIPRFEAQIGNKKAAIFFQIDRRTGLMIELQFASLLPLVQP